MKLEGTPNPACIQWKKRQERDLGAAVILSQIKWGPNARGRKNMQTLMFLGCFTCIRETFSKHGNGNFKV